MFVVNTTSATVGEVRPNSLPRKRAPSSRRRNPGFPRREVTLAPYGFLVGGVVVPGAGLVCAFGAAVAGAVVGAVVVGAVVVGAGASGIAGFAFPGAAFA